MCVHVLLLSQGSEELISEPVYSLGSALRYPRGTESWLSQPRGWHLPLWLVIFNFGVQSESAPEDPKTRSVVQGPHGRLTGKTM